MKKLLISDLHLKQKRIQRLIEDGDFDGLIFTGDVWDDFGDTVQQNVDTAIWLKKTMNDLGDKGVFVMGNHDQGYRFPNCLGYRCSGFTLEKCQAINEIMTQEDWNKLKLCHFEEGFLFSHAGVHMRIFGKPMDDTVDVEYIKTLCESAIESAKIGQHSMQLMAGRSRGGSQMVGGITWCDWNDDFEPIEGLNQVVGHTPSVCPKTMHTKNSKNYCLDTHLNHVSFLKDGEITWERI